MVGTLLETAGRRPAPEAVYAELRHAAAGAGLLDRAYGYYLWRGTVSYVPLLAGVFVALALPDTLASTGFSALLIGVGVVQVALLGHDAGHLAVFRSAPANRALGQLCWSLTAGVSFWYWSDRHTRHHNQTNDVEDDPDLAWIAIVAVSEEQAAARRGWLRRVTPYQALLVVAIIPVLGLGLRIEGWVFAVRHLGGRRLALEAGLIGLNALVWAAAIVHDGRWAVLFIGSQAVAGIYLFCVIAPNHKGMPIWTHGTRLSFPERQVLSSRNLTPHPVWDFLFGGLNYQIEHHLFPSMPRVNFSRARALVEPFCGRLGLPYEVSDPLSIYVALFAQAHRAGQAARTALPGSVPG